MSLILARILGLYFLAIGLAFLNNTERFKNIYKQVNKDENFLLMGGLMALLIGAVIVGLHNRWVLDWTLLITLIGWLSLVKGFALCVNPGVIKFFSFMENRSLLFYQTISLIYGIIGLFLLYQGSKGQGFS